MMNSEIDDEGDKDDDCDGNCPAVPHSTSAR